MINKIFVLVAIALSVLLVGCKEQTSSSEDQASEPQVEQIEMKIPDSGEITLVCYGTMTVGNQSAEKAHTYKIDLDILTANYLSTNDKGITTERTFSDAQLTDKLLTGKWSAIQNTTKEQASFKINRENLSYYSLFIQEFGVSGVRLEYETKGECQII